MSASDYLTARELAPHRFSALIIAALLTGRADQVDRLRAAFPEIASELDQRRRSPDGRTPVERDFDALELSRRPRTDDAESPAVRFSFGMWSYTSARSTTSRGAEELPNEP